MIAVLAILLTLTVACEPEPRLVDPELRVDGRPASEWQVPEHRKNEAAGRCAHYGGTVLWGPGAEVECCMICDHVPDEHQCACLVDYDGAF